MIDYTAVIDRNEAVHGAPVQYILHDLDPATSGVARTYTYTPPDSLHYPLNPDPLLSKAIALEIKRQIEEMNIDLG